MKRANPFREAGLRSLPPYQRMGIFLLLLIVTIGGAAWFAQDAASPNDADLVHEAKAIAPEDNALMGLGLAVRAIRYPDDFEQATDRIELALLGREWDAAWVEQLLARNRVALEHFARAQRAPGFQIRVISTQGERKALGNWLMLARLHALEARSLGMAGDPQAALDELVALARFGGRVRGIDGGRFVHHLLGTSIVRVALTTFQRVLIDAEVSHDRAAALIADLDSLRMDADAWERTLRGEYQWRKALLDESVAMREGRGSRRSRDPFAREVLDSMISLLPDRYALQRNRTLDRLAHHYRTYADITGAPCDASQLATRAEVFHALRAPDVLSLERNAIGHYWADLAGRSFAIHHDAMCVAESLVSAVEIMVGLRAYASESGEMPRSLDALVPAFFDPLPIDYFAGEPLRYSRRDHLLYSIGSDYEDAGGVWSPGQRCNAEIAWPIPFATAAHDARAPARLTCATPQS